MARKERSAGIVIFLEDPKRGRLYLLLDYGKHWDYPKGHVHKDETDREAAVRELEEETGIDDAEFVEGFEDEITYFFKGKGGLIHKTVLFFLGKTETRKIKLSHEHVGFEFLPYEEALERVTYAKAKETLRRAERFLKERSK